jgi:ribosomal protein L27
MLARGLAVFRPQPFTRGKMTKVQSYRKSPEASPCGQRYPNKAHLGVRCQSAEYMEAGHILVQQRKFIAKNLNVTKNKHFKLYPGENVMVGHKTSLFALVSGRVKFTHHVERGVKVVNVLPEQREELLREDLWRYRTEHVSTMEHNKHVCQLRTKANAAFPKALVNPPTGPRPVSQRITGKTKQRARDPWNNPTIKDPLEIEPHPYPLLGSLLAQHLSNVRAKQKGDDIRVEDEIVLEDPMIDKLRGHSAQR